MQGCSQTNENIENTGFGYTLSVIGGKHKIIILFWLFEKKVLRYNELKRYIGKISFKSLTNALKELESNEIIIRKEYPQVPPKVEYSLSKKGETLIPILECICDWGEINR
ncbi:TPA: helix-turn-helix transcriptional regulator [Listeria innocua]|nr:helix-turn-helix transcriptional regulator [Listeria innocua]